MPVPITIDNRDYLTSDEARDFLAVSRVTFLRLRERYKLVAKKRPVGRTLYYSKEDLQRIKEEMTEFQDVEPE